MNSLHLLTLTRSCVTRNFIQTRNAFNIKNIFGRGNKKQEKNNEFDQLSQENDVKLSSEYDSMKDRR